MDRESLAWAAGFFDGEGWASTARYHRVTGGMTATLTLGIGQADREVLDRFASIMGVGSVTGPTRSRTTLMWAYKVHGYEKVQAVACRLWPWLGSSAHRSPQFSVMVSNTPRFTRGGCSCDRS